MGRWGGCRTGGAHLRGDGDTTETLDHVVSILLGEDVDCLWDADAPQLDLHLA